MNILFYRYGNIVEPACINAFKEYGLTIIEETTEITNKALTDSDRLTLVEKYFKEQKPLFVFSVNFFPILSKLCTIYNVFYICWTVDSPVLELYSEDIKNPINRIFMFDYAQYERFSPLNPAGIFYLPLAADTKHYDSVISASPIADYKYDISFVGSLYNEKDKLAQALASSKLDAYSKGSVDAICQASQKLFGYYPAGDAVDSKLTTAIFNSLTDFVKIANPINSDVFNNYAVSHYYLGYHIGALERVNTLNALATHFNVDLFTRSNTSELANVKIHGGIQTLTEMPLVFNQSKINLNMTIRPIETGLPLRIFDIMGCGGFVMTNYQAEIPEYFEIGTDLETYSNLDELVDKCHYYLQNDDIRMKIARNGYEKVSTAHTYNERINAMIKAVVGGN